MTNNESITILAHPSKIYFENIKKFLKYKNINKKNSKIKIYWSTLGIGLSLSKQSVFDLPRSLLADNKNFRSYKKIFKSELGIEIKKIDKVPLYISIYLLFKSIFVLSSIYGNIDRLRSLSANKVKYGDLIHYSYIKFAYKEKIYFNSFFLLFLIYKSECVFYNLNSEKNNHGLTDIFLSNYTCYLQHGLPARFFACNNVQSYSIAATKASRVLKHSLGSYCQKKDWKNYKFLLSTLPKQQLDVYRQKAKNDLLRRFSGEIDTAINYMKVSAYSPNNLYKYGMVDGVIFLHDFFDSCDDYSGNIFYDIYDWAFQTLQFTYQNNLNFIVKPHPNSVRQSLVYETKLQKEFPSVRWLDRNTSNADIFQNTKSGISMFGSVFSEIAYHNLVPIAAGSHPADQFEFTYQPRNKDEYFSLLRDIRNLKPKKNARSKVVDFYVAHNYLNSSNEFYI